jgi:hypothetical protein
MAETFNPFAPKERSKVATPWGEFEVAPPNKARLEQITKLQAAAAELDEDAVQESVLLAIRTAAAGLENGGELADALEAAWDAGDVTIDQVRALAEFVGAEISGEAAQGND